MRSVFHFLLLSKQARHPGVDSTVSKLLFIQDLVDTVVYGDAVENLIRLPDKSVDAVITDPPWPETCLDFGISPDDLWEMWIRATDQICRVTDRLVVILGCDTNPDFLSSITLPFFRVIWLRRIPPVYRGSLMYGADVAYVYGHRRLNGIHRVIGGEINSGRRLQDDNPHPCCRNLNHMRKLVEYLTRPQDFVVDPFCGSGTTLAAAKYLGRRYFGIDNNFDYVGYSVNRLKGIAFGDKDVATVRSRASSL